MASIMFADGTTAMLDGEPQPGVPVVVLLHGLGRTPLDLTDPLSALPGLTYDRSAVTVRYRDEGFALQPPPTPVARVYSEPPLNAATSWRDALNAAGFATITYEQASPSGSIAPNIGQLLSAFTGPLSTMKALKDNPIALVGHSRGGLVARAFMAQAAATPQQMAFARRVTDVITLHTPHLGSAMAARAVEADPLVAQIQVILAALGIVSPAPLTLLRALTSSAGVAELTPGSPFLNAFAVTGQATGTEYHTFGGTSPGAVGIWADVYTPDSLIPLPVPFPVFHHGSLPVPVGVVPDAASFLPIGLIAPEPVLLTLAGLLVALEALAPELVAGRGDVLTTDDSSRLPFSTTHTTNPLNHAQALHDPGLQAQVIGLLARRRPQLSGRADVRIEPYPASTTAAAHRVVARDAASGMPITTGLVSVRDADGALALQQAVGADFTYAFERRVERVFDPDLHRWTVAVSGPTVDVALPDPYGTLEVVTGRG
jgi:predicted esterase